MTTEISHTPAAAVLIIGAEILSGKIQDANSPFLIRSLRSRGIDLREIRTIGDSVEAIGESVKSLSPTVDHLFTTGGIGPTHDDVTMQGVAAAFDLAIVRNQEMVDLLTSHFGDRLNPSRLSMADLPEGTRLVRGQESFIPAIQVKNVTILPGIPSLAQACFRAMAQQLVGSPFHSDYLLLSASESVIASHLAKTQEEMPSVSIGSYPHQHDNQWRVRVTVDGHNQNDIQTAIERIRSGLDADWIIDET